MKLASWNVNSLKVRLPQLSAWVADAQPDVLGLQETKLEDEKFPLEQIRALGYHAAFSGQRTYNGVALLSRAPASDIINELAGPDGVADYEDIVRIAQERGIPPAKVDSWLKRWAQEGEIYSPVKNKYKLVERL